MNILTPNRIIEKGDQYLDGEKWKPVPDIDIGLQIQFTDYAQVRRPSEKPLREKPDTRPNSSPTEVRECAVSPTPILSGDQIAADCAKARIKKDEPISPRKAEAMARAARSIVEYEDQLAISPHRETDSPRPAKAESEKSPVPTHSGTGDTLAPDIVPCGACGSILCGGGPSGIGCRASVDPPETEPFTPEQIKHAKETLNSHLKIKFPKGTDCIWTGRNGSFNQYGLDGMTLEDKVMLFPIGKRGVGNCTIQFPTSTIPELVDWLLRQQK